MDEEAGVDEGGDTVDGKAGRDQSSLECCLPAGPHPGCWSQVPTLRFSRKGCPLSVSLPSEHLFRGPGRGCLTMALQALAAEKMSACNLERAASGS